MRTIMGWFFVVLMLIAFVTGHWFTGIVFMLAAGGAFPPLEQHLESIRRRELR